VRGAEEDPTSSVPALAEASHSSNILAGSQAPWFQPGASSACFLCLREGSFEAKKGRFGIANVPRLPERSREQNSPCCLRQSSSVLAATLASCLGAGRRFRGLWAQGFRHGSWTSVPEWRPSVRLPFSGAPEFWYTQHTLVRVLLYVQSRTTLVELQCNLVQSNFL